MGQTRTVNVTYVVGEETIDEFVQAVLEVKAALVRTIVEGEALTGEADGNVLDELARALAAISPGLSDAPADIEDEALINDLVRAATERWRSVHPSGPTGDAGGADPAAARTLRTALEVLARVLRGPRAQRFRIASASNPGVQYTIEAADGDVTCSCPGFEYRGQCRHARDVKTALASGGATPPGYTAVA
jgi:hypothetical protein